MPSGPQTVEELLRLVASPAQMRAIAPSLTVSAAGSATRPAATARDTAADVAARARAILRRDGLGAVSGVAAVPLCERLVAAVTALHAHGLPACFVYAFDEPWLLGDHVRTAIAALLGHEYALAEDVWAWLIPRGSAGWPAHRGVADVLLDRDAPEVLNVWIALTEVTADRACMHAVPLGQDPGYPIALETLETTAGEPLPAQAGDALFWNANVLHWGGTCAPEAAGPRVSCSFTLLRAGATAALRERLPSAPPADALDLTARMDTLARMVLLYGDAERSDVSPVVEEWARVTLALASRFGLRKAP
jgi:hypothetical protein